MIFQGPGQAQRRMETEIQSPDKPVNQLKAHNTSNSQNPFLEAKETIWRANEKKFCKNGWI